MGKSKNKNEKRINLDRNISVIYPDLAKKKKKKK